MNKKSSFCVWKHTGYETDNAKYYMPACVEIVHSLHGEMFKFCPHCAREIKWKEKFCIIEEMFKECGINVNFVDMEHAGLSGAPQWKDDIVNDLKRIEHKIDLLGTSLYSD